MESAYKKILKDLERLAASRVKPDIFGADHHGYVLNPALPEATVRKFECDHKVTLPQDYRRFLIEAGNGGAGPYYGVFKLGEMDDGWGYSAWEENNGFVGSLSQPFPYREAWNDLTGEPDADWEDEEAYERQLSAFEACYWNPEHVNGAIPICHLGCALRQWLIVTGPQAGHIWNDERADLRGLSPLTRKAAERVTFYQWYREWLDSALRNLQQASR